MSSHSPAPRRYDLDWMRVLAILVIFIFHSCRFFDLGGWHVKNPERYLSVQIWIAFLSMWIMPFIFAISGASLFYAMNKGGFGTFLKDKTLRLLIPLAVGCFTHIGLQVYYERVTQAGYTGSFMEFLPHYFEGWYAFGGNFAWMGLHLWYLEMLFLFSLMMYPLFRLIKYWARRMDRTPDAAASATPSAPVRSPWITIASAIGIYLLALPISALLTTLNPGTLTGMRGFGGAPLPTYMLFFLYGFMLIASSPMQQLITRLRFVSLLAGLGAFVGIVMLWMNGGDPVYGSMRYNEIFGLWGFGAWAFVMALLGFGFRYATRSTPFLRYANEAVLPFYIMHQTVILTIGFFVVYWPINDVAKFVLIAVSSFAIIMALYEYGVKRVGALRFLFGMKPLPASADVALLAHAAE